MNGLENNYLEHHGILGQKWHKRNGPPYPLGSGDHSKSEQNAGWKKSLGGGRNEDLYDRKEVSSARKTAKTLNKHDAARLQDEYHAKQYEKQGYLETDIYSHNAQKLYDKAKNTKNERKAERLRNKAEKIVDKGSDKANKYFEKSKEYEEYAKQHEDAVKQILNDVSGTYNIESKEIKRIANRGEVAAAAIYGQITMGVIGNAALANAVAKREKGTKYTVSEKSEKQKSQEREAAYREERESVKKIVDQDRGTIAKQASREMAKDIIRWQKEGSENPNKAFSGKSEAEIARIIEKKINSKIMGHEDSFAGKGPNGKVDFIIDGIEEYGGGQPLDVEYDPNTKKITGMWWS